MKPCELASEHILMPADELEHLLAAQNWSEAHRVLSKGHAAKLFLGDQGSVATLHRALNLLQPHQAEINAALGSGSFQSGAGLYLHHYHLLQVGLTNWGLQCFLGLRRYFCPDTANCRRLQIAEAECSLPRISFVLSLVAANKEIIPHNGSFLRNASISHYRLCCIPLSFVLCRRKVARQRG